MVQLGDLIALVKQHPPLYDNTDPQFKIMVIREAAWNDIAEKLGISISIAKNKWKNLRDSHAKFLKAKHASGDVPPNLFKYRHWQWAEAMDWMTGFNSGWRAPEEADQPPAPPTLPHEGATPAGPELYEPDDEETLAASRALWDERRKRKARVINQQAKRNISQRVPENVVSRCRHNLDATEHIFMGYAKMLKSFSRRRQAMVKMKIAQLMLEHELEHIRETSRDTSVHIAPLTGGGGGGGTDPLDSFDDQPPLNFKHEPMEAGEGSEF